MLLASMVFYEESYFHLIVDSVSLMYYLLLTSYIIFSLSLTFNSVMRSGSLQVLFRIHRASQMCNWDFHYIQKFSDQFLFKCSFCPFLPLLPYICGHNWRCPTDLWEPAIFFLFFLFFRFDNLDRPMSKFIVSFFFILPAPFGCLALKIHEAVYHCFTYCVLTPGFSFVL